MSIFMFRELKWEVVVRFVEIGGIVYHYYLNFLLVIATEYWISDLILYD